MKRENMFFDKKKKMVTEIMITENSFSRRVGCYGYGVSLAATERK